MKTLTDFRKTVETGVDPPLVVLLEYWREPLQIIKAQVGCVDATI